MAYLGWICYSLCIEGGIDLLSCRCWTNGATSGYDRMTYHKTALPPAPINLPLYYLH